MSQHQVGTLSLNIKAQHIVSTFCLNIKSKPSVSTLSLNSQSQRYASTLNIQFPVQCEENMMTSLQRWEFMSFPQKMKLDQMEGFDLIIQ